ncbi:MAG: hypothetical protein WDO15_18750 [Bacteroidota bacterium]
MVSFIGGSCSSKENFHVMILPSTAEKDKFKVSVFGRRVYAGGVIVTRIDLIDGSIGTVV